MEKKYDNYKLCYVESSQYPGELITLYFTELDDVTKQWGDDWNDRPANCNAGEPYTDERDIYSIYIEIRGYGNTTFGGKVYSVEDMNTKKAVWLIHENTFFEGGDTLSDILNKIKEYNNATEEYNHIDVFVEYGGNK